MILARCNILGILDVRRQTERKTRSHSLALSPWCRMNSGWILSTSAALFGLMHLRAVLISSVEKSPERSRSALGACPRYLTIVVMFQVKALSALVNLPLVMSRAAMESAVMGHTDSLPGWSAC